MRHERHARHGGSDARAFTVLQCIHALRPTVRIAIGKSLLDFVERSTVHPTPQVARVDESDADAPRGSGLEQCLAHLVAVPVQVVELADRRDAGLQHLAKHVSAMFEVGFGVEVFRGSIHELSPLPEVAGA